MMEAGEDCSSFWEPRSFYRTTQRVTDGRRLCRDLVALLKERADIEKDYAKQLHGWADKWRHVVEKGPEYGTTEALWKGFLTEAEKLGDLHLNMKDKLCKDVIVEVKGWAKDTYHKSMLQIKEEKEMEDSFKKAQQPWEKLFNKVEDAKKEYHTAARKQRSALHELIDALSDGYLSRNQLKKIQDHLIQCKYNLNKAKGKYERALHDIHLYNPKYIGDMAEVFDKSQEMEGQRLKFFKEIMFSVYKCLDLSKNIDFQKIYEEFSAEIDNANPKKDLQWWSENYGALMDMKWPVFEEYQEVWREIVKGKSRTEVAYGTALTNWRAIAEDSYEYGPKREMSTQNQPDNRGKNTSKAKKEMKTTSRDIATNKRRAANPFDEDESDPDETFIDCGESAFRESILLSDEQNLQGGDMLE